MRHNLLMSQSSRSHFKCLNAQPELIFPYANACGWLKMLFAQESTNF